MVGNGAFAALAGTPSSPLLEFFFLFYCFPSGSRLTDTFSFFPRFLVLYGLFSLLLGYYCSLAWLVLSCSWFMLQGPAFFPGHLHRSRVTLQVRAEDSPIPPQGRIMISLSRISCNNQWYIMVNQLAILFLCLSWWTILIHFYDKFGGIQYFVMSKSKSIFDIELQWKSIIESFELSKRISEKIC